jgi:hypothetical protein
MEDRESYDAEFQRMIAEVMEGAGPRAFGFSSSGCGECRSQWLNCPNCRSGALACVFGPVAHCDRCDHEFPVPTIMFGAASAVEAKTPPEPKRIRPVDAIAYCANCHTATLTELEPAGASQKCCTCVRDLRLLVIPSAEPVPLQFGTRITINVLAALTWQSFEQFLEFLFGRMGFSVERTPIQDQGADLILTSGDGFRAAVQAKRYAGLVANSAIQEVLGGMAFHHCQFGLVVTTSGYTKAARELAEAVQSLLLIDGVT